MATDGGWRAAASGCQGSRAVLKGQLLEQITGPTRSPALFYTAYARIDTSLSPRKWGGFEGAEVPPPLLKTVGAGVAGANCGEANLTLLCPPPFFRFKRLPVPSFCHDYQLPLVCG